MPSVMRRFLSLVASLVVPVAVYACANDDNTPPGPKPFVGVDSSPTTETGVADAAPEAEAAVDAPIDAAPLPVRCTQAEFDAVASAVGGDYTATATPIDIEFGPAPAQYTNHCIKVKVGAIVSFKGKFSMHPLERNGGDVPTPIPVLTSTDQAADTLALTMPRAATFGYQCNFHPGIMFGAIQVVP